MKDDRISIIGLLIKLIIVVGFVFLLMWLMPIKKYDHLNPLLDQVFSDNIDRLRDAGKAYYTTDRMPEDLEEKKRMSLRTMVDTKLLLPLIDKDGKQCDLDESYVEVVKLENEYLMTINLKCGEQEDYIIEYIGCYDFCEDKSCDTDNVVAYLYKRTVTKNQSNATCPVGYKLSGGSCYKYTSTQGVKDALVTKLPDIIQSVSAEKVYKDGEVIYKPATNRYEYVYANKVPSTTVKPGGTYSCNNTYTGTCYKTIPAKYENKKTAKYDYRTEKECETKKVPFTDYKNVPVYGTEKKCTIKYEAPCSGCAPIPKEVCTTVTVQTGTKKEAFTNYRNEEVCKNVTKKVFSHYEYTKVLVTPEREVAYDCQKTETTTCSHPDTTITTYSCPAGYTDNGSNCKKQVFDVMDCKDVLNSTLVGDATVENGAKCAINTGKEFSHYSCEVHGDDAKLVDDKNGICEIKKPGGTKFSCEDGSNPTSDGKCYYGTTTTQTAKPTINTWTDSVLEYKWSLEPELEGWEKVKKEDYKI